MNENKDYQEIDINLLIPFKNHPFKLYQGQRFADMVVSIRENGVMTPIIVRPADDDKYEILSGHNRTEAAREAGLANIPAVVYKDLSDDDATFIVTESNLLQRSFADLIHSERAAVIAVHYNSMKMKSGYRSDLLKGIEDETCEQVVPRSRTSDKVAEQYGLSPDMIKRYLRIHKLIPQLKNRLDNDEFGIVAAVSLSYLTSDEQNDLETIF